MDASIRRLALRSAAKVALGSFVMGCGGVMLAEGQEPDAASGDANAHDAAAKSDATYTSLACTAPLDVDASGVSEETFQCCVADVQSAVGDASPWGDPNGPDASLVTSNPSADNCCKAILARIDHEPDGGSLGADYQAAGDAIAWCCMALGQPEGPACTPWGPPTPPAMEVA